MSACPRCGAGIEEGKAYCSNPSCGAVPGRPGAEQGTRPQKFIPVKLPFDFVLLARLGAALIVLLAAAFFYFFAKP